MGHGTSSNLTLHKLRQNKKHHSPLDQLRFGGPLGGSARANGHRRSHSEVCQLDISATHTRCQANRSSALRKVLATRCNSDEKHGLISLVQLIKFNYIASCSMERNYSGKVRFFSIRELFLETSNVSARPQAASRTQIHKQLPQRGCLITSKASQEQFMGSGWVEIRDFWSQWTNHPKISHSFGRFF